MTGSVLLHNFVTCGKTFFCFNLHYCQSNTPKASDFAKCRFIFETPPEVEYPSGPASRSDRCGGSQPATEKQARIGKGTSWFVHVWNQGGKQPKPTKCGFKRLSPSLLLRLSYFLFGPRSSPFFPACWACRCLPPFLTGVNTKVSHMNCGTWCCRVRLYLAFKPHFVCVCVRNASLTRCRQSWPEQKRLPVASLCWVWRWASLSTRWVLLLLIVLIGARRALRLFFPPSTAFNSTDLYKRSFW